MRMFTSLFTVLYVLLTTSVAKAEETLSFGIVPQQSASKLARLWSPILRHLSDKTGIKLQFKTAPNIPVFETRLYAGKYDISYMNPYHYTVAHDRAGYKAIARQKNKRIVGILVSHKEGDIADIAQLSGATLAFPSPAAFAASILPRAFLKKSGIDFTAKYVSSHDSVYRSVQLRLYPAGGGIIRTLRNADKKVSDDLKTLWQSQGYTPHAFAIHPRVKQSKVEQVKQAMLDMANDPTGQALLANIKFKGIESGKDSDWDDIRALNIQELE